MPPDRACMSRPAAVPVAVTGLLNGAAALVAWCDQRGGE